MYQYYEYSRTSVMWTPEGRAKSIHNSEVSTLVKLGVARATNHSQWPIMYTGMSNECP